MTQFILLITLIFSGPAPSEPATRNCDDLVRRLNKHDYEATESVSISHNGDMGIEIFLLVSDKSLVINFRTKGGGKCIDDDDEMTVTLVNGQEFTMTNDNQFNCDGVYSQHFGENNGKDHELNQLVNNEVSRLRITTNEIPVTQELTPAQGAKLNALIGCLADKL